MITGSCARISSRAGRFALSSSTGRSSTGGQNAPTGAFTAPSGRRPPSRLSRARAHAAAARVGRRIQTGGSSGASAAALPDFATKDYSLDPRLAGRRMEVRVSQREVITFCLDTGELACRHRRLFAKHRTLAAPEHQRLLEVLRGERRSREPEVELRPFAHDNPG